MKIKKILFIVFFVSIFLQNAYIVVAEAPASLIYLSPKTGTFLMGSTFDLGVYLDTMKNSLNAVELKVDFDPKKLSIVNPSGGQSIFGIWVEPPVYNNSKGTLSMSGVVPEGLVTNSGLISKITFKVISEGNTTILVSKETNAYLNDGLGTKVNLSLGRADLNLKDRDPDGVVISSSSHPFSVNWYNNNNPKFFWEGVGEGYALLLDSNSQTAPGNTITTTDNNISYEDLVDGIWYLHVKNKEKNGWGSVSNFQFKIDTTPPLDFKPDINKIVGNDRDEYMVNFETSDALSGISHYEVGILSSERDSNELPVFVEAKSPYVLPGTNIKNLKVVIKAYDTAGNVREAHVALVGDRTKYYILGSLVLILLLISTHYLFGHHILRNLKKAYNLFKYISRKEKTDEDVDLDSKGGIINE